MAGTTRREIAEKALFKHKGEIVYLETLKSYIRYDLTGNESTILDYLFLMRNTGLIEEVQTEIQGVTKWLILPDNQKNGFEKQENLKITDI